MNAVLQAHALGKSYGQRQALTDCTLKIPPGHVVGLVGPNGAGKTTLLKIACGMLAPTTGRIEVLGEQPAAGPAQLARVGYVAQDTPTYASLSVADHLKLGAKLNPRWDAKLARARIDQLDLDPRQKAAKLSGGQRAQLALTVAAGRRIESQPTGTSQRYALTHFHPGQARTVLPQVSIRRILNLPGPLRKLRCVKLVTRAVNGRADQVRRRDPDPSGRSASDHAVRDAAVS